ncbi:GNAT family N-acetyltransferase [Paenibacillus terrigena]|uniref:GNAT family N-acetyltransferase n=1 Tax=Paenibacillus terrigena TaxID=369333 RepID=UPI0028D0E2E2|nr:GNAT family N-acetyltransferase [Paenibacillus terrigena]
MFIAEGQLSIRRLRDHEEDYAFIFKWLNDEKLLRYIEGPSTRYTMEQIIAKYGSRARGEHVVTPCIMEWNNTAIGYVQFYPLQEDEIELYEVTSTSDQSPYGIDLFIGETDYWDQGIGTTALKSVVRYLLTEQGAADVYIDPQTWNTRAIRSYEKCGFKKVKVITAHELFDGEYRDNQIMRVSLDELHMQIYLDNIVALFRDELQDNLAGIYLHGSLAMGCFNPSRSDVDCLVVVREKLTLENNKRIAQLALSVHDGLPNARGFEFSILLGDYLKSFVYPTPVEFHYSDYHRERYLADENYLCGGYEDKDVAAQLMVAYHRGIALYGTPLHELYEPIDRSVYLASILHDVEEAAEDIIHNPPAYLTAMYVTLNLCRVLYYIREGVIASKREGGAWGVQVLPPPFQAVVQQCLDEYNGKIDRSDVEPSELSEFIRYMLGEIQVGNSSAC